MWCSSLELIDVVFRSFSEFPPILAALAKSKHVSTVTSSVFTILIVRLEIAESTDSTVTMIHALATL